MAMTAMRVPGGLVRLAERIKKAIAELEQQEGA